MQKAKINDLIKSLHVSDCPERGWFAGLVINIEVDPTDGVEYVYFRKDWDASNSKEIIQQSGKEILRVPQNGTPTNLGNIMNCITIIPRYNY